MDEPTMCEWRDTKASEQTEIAIHKLTNRQETTLAHSQSTNNLASQKSVTELYGRCGLGRGGRHRRQRGQEAAEAYLYTYIYLNSELATTKYTR